MRRADEKTWKKTGRTIIEHDFKNIQRKKISAGQLLTDRTSHDSKLGTLEKQGGEAPGAEEYPLYLQNAAKMMEVEESMIRQRELFVCL